MENLIQLSADDFARIIKKTVGDVLDKLKHNPAPKYVTPKYFQIYFGFKSVQTVYNLVNQEIISAVKMKGTNCWMIPIEEKERYEKESKNITRKKYFCQQDFSDKKI